MVRTRSTMDTVTSKTAADSGKKSGKAAKRDLSGTAAYNTENVQHVVSMLTHLNLAAASLAKAADTLASVSAHEISPDGLLGGRGYVMSVKDIRADIASAENLVTDLTDTLADELTNPKWELTPEDIQKYKDQAKVSDAESTMDAKQETDAALGDTEPTGGDTAEADPPTEEIPDFLGELAPQSTDTMQVPPLAQPAADVPPEPVSTVGAPDALPDVVQPAAQPQLPYKKLASLIGHSDRDPVAQALRPHILFNLLDGHTAGQ